MPTALALQMTAQMNSSSSFDAPTLQRLQHGTEMRSAGQGRASSFLGGMWSRVLAGEEQYAQWARSRIL